MKTSRLAWVGVMGLACMFLAGTAQAKSDKEFDARIRTLEKVMAELQQRVAMLEAGTTPETPMSEESILRWAAENGHGDIAQAILGKGADVNAADAQGRTALMLAVEKGHALVVQVLLSAGADVNAKDAQGRTAANRAQDNNFPLILQALTNAGATAEKSAAPKPKTPADSSNSTPTPTPAAAQKPVDNSNAKALIEAANGGDIAQVRALLAAGADPNSRNEKGYTPLMLAAASNYIEIVRLLLEKGADPNLQSVPGYTALMLATAEGHDSIVRVLIERGANIRLKSANGKTALDLAQTLKNELLTGMLENAQSMIAPGKYEVTMKAVSEKQTEDDLLPTWKKKAREMCGGKGYKEISREYQQPNTDEQQITGVIECQ